MASGLGFGGRRGFFYIIFFMKGWWEGGGGFRWGGHRSRLGFQTVVSSFFYFLYFYEIVINESSTEIKYTYMYIGQQHDAQTQHQSPTPVQ